MLRTITSVGRNVARCNSLWMLQQNSVPMQANARMLSTQGSLDLSGVFPPIPTPFTANEDVDYDKYQENVKKWNSHELSGLVVHGSNGECAYLDTAERIETVKKVREWTPSDRLVIAGTGLESTRHTIELTRAVADVGADAVMVVTPCYYKGRMDTQALIAHYTKVADASPVPVILYSVPANTNLDLAGDAVIPLSQHPNVIGMKDSGGDIAKIANLVYKTENNNFQMLAGSTSFLYPALSVGCVGGVMALANCLPAECIRLQKLVEEGNHEEARKLQHRTIMPNAAVTRLYGIAGLKTAMEWFGFHGGITRSPLLPLNDAQKEGLRKIFVDNGFL